MEQNIKSQGMPRVTKHAASLLLLTSILFALMPQAGRGGSKWELIAVGRRRPPQYRWRDISHIMSKSFGLMRWSGYRSICARHAPHPSGFAAHLPLGEGSEASLSLAAGIGFPLRGSWLAKCVARARLMRWSGHRSICCKPCTSSTAEQGIGSCHFCIN